MAITGRSRMLISMGSDTFNAGRAFTTQNRSFVVPGRGAVKSGEHLKTLVPLSSRTFFNVTPVQHRSSLCVAFYFLRH